VTRWGYGMEAIEAVLFEKDHGLRDYPTAWIAAPAGSLRTSNRCSSCWPTRPSSAFLSGAADGRWSAPGAGCPS
jgi:hypothetical protein